MVGDEIHVATDASYDDSPSPPDSPTVWYQKQKEARLASAQLFVKYDEEEQSSEYSSEASPRKSIEATDDDDYEDEGEVEGGDESEGDYPMTDSDPSDEEELTHRQPTKRNRDDDDDTYSTNSDWDEYGKVKHFVDEYALSVTRVDKSELWNEDQNKIHKLIYLRGYHPLLPSWWRLNFKMWGISQERFDDLFTPRGSKKKVAIHAYGSEVAACKALESLFYLSQTVKDYEESRLPEKIGPAVVKGIKGYYEWALRDIGIRNRQNVFPTLLVKEYKPDFHIKTGLKTPEKQRGDKGSSDDEDPFAQKKQADDFQAALSADLSRRLKAMGRQWRDLLWDRKSRSFVAQPPTLYAFVAVQHMLILASHDPTSGENPVIVLEQLRLNDRGQWLWNALTMAIPINALRDALHGLLDLPQVAKKLAEDEEDIDL